MGRRPLRLTDNQTTPGQFCQINAVQIDVIDYNPSFDSHCERSVKAEAMAGGHSVPDGGRITPDTADPAALGAVPCHLSQIPPGGMPDRPDHSPPEFS